MSAKEDSLRSLFLDLYDADGEEAVAGILGKSGFDVPSNWEPLGGMDGNFALVQNQQADEISALVEKLTNSIDALLLRKIRELGIDPLSREAPRTMQDAFSLAYPRDPWRGKMGSGEDIQVHPGTRKRGVLSPVIYDAGEGQRPEDFRTTFLSVLKGSKVNIPFVQGAFNMGGTGALVFCGERRYQLIGSLRFDDPRRHFGFTLVRRQPLPELAPGEFAPRGSRYEYLVVGGQVPTFVLNGSLDLRLMGRMFDTGTVIKLFSYRFSRSNANIAQDIAQQVGECLVEPLLPIAFVEDAQRYKDSKRLDARIVGMERKVREAEWQEHVEFARELPLDLGKHGRAVVRLYVLRSSAKGLTVAETRERVRRALKSSGKSVVFTINGQSHGGWASEFVSRRLKMPLLKDDILAFVDCTSLDCNFRNDVFMASRDRLVSSEKTEAIRSGLARVLGPVLKPIHDRRMHSLETDSGTEKELTKAIQSYYRELNIPKEMRDLVQGQLGRLESTHKKEEKGEKGAKVAKGAHGASGGAKPRSSGAGEPAKDPLQIGLGKRIPTIFRLRSPSANEGSPAAKVSHGGTGKVRFVTDAESEFFTRAKSPGELEITLLNHKSGDNSDVSSGGPKRPGRRALPELLSYERSGPKDGQIVLNLKAEPGVQVGDSLHIRASLRCEGADIEETLWLRVVEPRGDGSEPSSDAADEQNDPGLPDLILVAKRRRDADVDGDAGFSVEKTWEELAASGLEIDESVVVLPVLDGEQRVSKVYVNLDSGVFQGYMTESPSAQPLQRRAIFDRYVAVMYLHTLLLASEIASQRFEFRRSGEDDPVSPDDFMKRVIAGGYANLVLRFDAKKVMALSDED